MLFITTLILVRWWYLVLMSCHSLITAFHCLINVCHCPITAFHCLVTVCHCLITAFHCLVTVCHCLIIASHSLITACQSCFTKLHSTAILFIKKVSRCDFVRTGFIDLYITFDTVNHSIKLRKLSAYRIAVYIILPNKSCAPGIL